MRDETKPIELWPCGYDARCNVKNCKPKATMLARSVDSGGQPMKQYELCSIHAAGRAAGEAEGPGDREAKLGRQT
jgi:hypothetical protein